MSTFTDSKGNTYTAVLATRTIEQENELLKKIEDMPSVNSMRTLSNSLRSADNICLLGDSISFGVGVTAADEVWSYNFKEFLRSVKSIKSIGFQTVLDDFNHYHSVSLNNKENWNKNYLNAYAINGFSYDSEIIEEILTIYTGMIQQEKCKLYFVGNEVDSVIEIYVKETLKQTLSIDSSLNNKIIKSKELDMGTGVNDIKVVLKSGKISVSGVEYIVNDNKQIDIFATGGRRIRYIKPDVLTEYLKYDLMVFQLSYNDIVGGSNEVQVEEVVQILRNIATHYIDNNKTFVYLNTVWDVPENENWVLSELNTLFDGYEKFHNINYRSTIKNISGDIANSQYRINVLNEWKDTAHLNTFGNKRLFDYLLLNVFGVFSHFSKKATVDYKNYSVTNDKNTIGENLYASIVLGVNNKVLDSKGFLSLVGVGNTANSDRVCAFGNYNHLEDYNSAAFGYYNNLARPFSLAIGFFCNSKNSGLNFSLSNKAGESRNIFKQIRVCTTRNDSEQFTRDGLGSALIYTNKDTRNILKGKILCFSEDNIFSIFEINCLIVNSDDKNTLHEIDNSLNGIIEKTNPNNVSCSVKCSNNNTYTIRVKSNDSTILKWTCDLEVIEISK